MFFIPDYQPPPSPVNIVLVESVHVCDDPETTTGDSLVLEDPIGTMSDSMDADLSIPDDFREAMADFNEGNFMDLDDALREDTSNEQ